MKKGLPIRLVLTSLTGLICFTSLLVFWLASFLTASRLTRDDAREFRKLQLAAVSGSLLQYFSLAPRVAKELVGHVDRRISGDITYTHLDRVVLKALPLISATALQGSGMAVRRRALPGDLAAPAGCDQDVALISTGPFFVYLYQNRSAPTLHVIRLPNTVDSPSPEAIDIGNCDIVTWPALRERFDLPTGTEQSPAALATVFQWGNRWISTVGSPMLSFAAGFTNLEGTQAGIHWVDSSMKPSLLAPILQKLHRTGREVVFVLDHDCTLLAASTGSVFSNTSTSAKGGGGAGVYWRSGTDPENHAWVVQVTAALQRITGGSQSCLAPSVPQELELSVGCLLANALRVQDEYGLNLLVVSVARHRDVMHQFVLARDISLSVGGGILVISVVVIFVACSVLTRTLRGLCGVLASISDLNLEAVDEDAIEKHASRLKEIRLLQAALIAAVRRLREYRTYLPAALYLDEGMPGLTAAAVSSVAQGTVAKDPTLVLQPVPTAEAGSNQLAHEPSGSSGGSNNFLSATLRSPMANGNRRISFVAPVTPSAGAHTPQQLNLGLGLAVRPCATVLVADLTRFHSLAAKLGPDVVDVHGRYVSLVLAVVKQNLGVADGFSGDHVLASWNTHHPSRGHRQCACQCLAELRHNLQPLAVAHDLTIRIAVATGQAGFGSLGTTERRAYSVIGPAVALAHDTVKRLKHWPQSEPVLAAVASSTATDEMRQIYSFTPFDVFARRDELGASMALTVLHAFTSTRRTSGNADSEWMYELKKGDESTADNEVWRFVRMLEMSAAEVARQMPTLAAAHPHFEQQARQALLLLQPSDAMAAPSLSGPLWQRPKETDLGSVLLTPKHGAGPSSTPTTPHPQQASDRPSLPGEMHTLATPVVSPKSAYARAFPLTLSLLFPPAAVPELASH